MNTLLSIDTITKESVRLFNNSNLFILNLERQYELANDIFVPSAPAIISTKELVILGTAAILTKNPEVTRRFWSGWLT